MTYNELKTEIEKMPMSWHPAILMTVVESALRHKCFMPGGMARVIQKAEDDFNSCPKCAASARSSSFGK